MHPHDEDPETTMDAADETREVNTDNDFLLGTDAASIRPMLFPMMTNRQQAYRTAAWIKSMAITLPDDGTGLEFEDIDNAIRNT